MFGEDVQLSSNQKKLINCMILSKKKESKKYINKYSK